MAKSILRVTEGHCVVKVSGGAGTETIALKTDLLKYNDSNPDNVSRYPTEVAGSTVYVNLVALTWTGEAATVITIVRDSVRIATLAGSRSAQLSFVKDYMVADSVKNTSDIVVTISGGQGEVWIALQKMKGYTSTIETSLLGHYDDLDQVGV